MIPGGKTIEFPTLANLNQHCKLERLFESVERGFTK